MLLTLIAIVLTMAIYGQKNGYVSINYGPSITLNDYASTQMNKDGAGFAKNGDKLGLGFAYKLSKSFGIAADFAIMGHNVDAEALEKGYTKEYPGIQWSVNEATYLIGGIMFGGYGSFEISDNTSFDTKALIGYNFIISPEMLITGRTTQTTASVVMEQVSAGAFGYDLYAGFRFNVSKSVCLMLGIDYGGFNAEIKDAVVRDSYGNKETHTYDQGVTTLNITGGIGLRI